MAIHQKYAVDRMNGKMYAITMRHWIAILERASLAHFSLEIPYAGTHKTQSSMHDSTF